MSIDGNWILALTFGSAIASVIAIRVTFRHASNTRDAVVTPPVFAVIGSLVGISIGMIWLSDREGRVDIEKGALLLMSGLLAGTFMGVGAKEGYSRMRCGKAVVFLLVVTLLAGSIGAPIGWIVGAFSSEGWYDTQVGVSRMLSGIGIGSCVGLLLGLSEVVLRRRGAT